MKSGEFNPCGPRQHLFRFVPGTRRCRENYDSCESDNLAGRAEHAQVQASLVEKLFTHHKVAASGRSGDVE